MHGNSKLPALLLRLRQKCLNLSAWRFITLCDSRNTAKIAGARKKLIDGQIDEAQKLLTEIAIALQKRQQDLKMGDQETKDLGQREKVTHIPKTALTPQPPLPIIGEGGWGGEGRLRGCDFFRLADLVADIQVNMTELADTESTEPIVSPPHPVIRWLGYWRSFRACT